MFSSVTALASRLRESPEHIDDVCAGIVNTSAGGELLLFIDQFEELFTAGVDEAHRATFAQLIAAITHTKAVRLVLTMRDIM